MPALLPDQFHGPGNVSASVFNSAVKRVTCPPQLLRSGLHDLLSIGLPLPPQPGRQVAPGRSPARTTLPSAATAARSPGHGGHVASALARHFESRLLQGGDDVGAALHDAVLDALREVVPDQLARVGLDGQTGP